MALRHKAAEVVAAYGQALAGPRAYMDGDVGILFDAAVLPYSKDEIKSALIDYASANARDEGKLETLGDFYSYLSYFIDGLEEREEADPDADIFEESRLERASLEADWQQALARTRRTRGFRQIFKLWVNPDA